MLLSELIEKLKVLRRRLCCYGGNTDNFCDCKYLDTEPKKVRPRQEGIQFNRESSEQTGCCEVRAAIDLLSSIKIDPEDWKGLIGSKG